MSYGDEEDYKRHITGTERATRPNVERQQKERVDRQAQQKELLKLKQKLELKQLKEQKDKKQDTRGTKGKMEQVQKQVENAQQKPTPEVILQKERERKALMDKQAAEEKMKNVG